ncbi:uncharacterized protein DUF1672 [Cytobacillus horneckiae]|uniref:DUF1672 family protein n=1 Tax=Cytobacillus horneckiae TaxID=549687 RepID=UPI0019D30052|nr:DUF1672 family protein [Cytobacillus horneckiae]MBN6884861.1 DUF1672 family protein [Cytobacillus horneckiae]MCM3179394.1 DUF1672 domain-containing protein [Cytobacillus horneckiae]
MYNKTKIFLLCSVGISMMLGGCLDMNSTDTNNDNEKAKETLAASSGDTMVSVQDYTGEGYALPYGKETDQIAEANRDQIEEATIKFFKENYKTDVYVHNIVGARDGATIFVESKGELQFYTYAVVPIDELGKKVMIDKIWADEFQVENAIKGGLYHMIFSEEFKKLDNYLESLAAKGQVTGKTKEALQNAGGHGYMTPYYFIALTSKEEAIKPVYDLYISNPDENTENLRNSYEEGLFIPENFKVNIQLFMADKQAKPSKEIFKQVTKELEEMNSIPKGTYSFSLNDNFIDKQSSEGAKDNSLKRGFPDYIIKE